MGYLITAAVLIFGYVSAQDPDCDYRQNVRPNEVFYINNNYGPGRTCRYIGICSEGYNCRVDCNLNLPSSNGCTADRLLISRSGDPTLTGAEVYCGRRSLSSVSTGQSISIGLIAPTSSRGGSFTCNLTSQQAPVTPTPPVCRCGVRRVTRIVGGQETRVNEYPMMAGILDNSQESIYCGGVIISNLHVMTAAHCVYPYVQRPAALSLVLGAHYIQNSGSGTRYSISRFVVHENYNANTFDYDIALALPTREILFSDTVMPVCLPFKYENVDLTNRAATLLGWGSTTFGGPTSNALRKVDVNIYDQNRCRASEGNNVGERQICTYSSGKDACQYDSGGPLLYTDPSTGLLMNIGIVSNGNACATGHPGINTRVTSFLRWIVNNANSQFCIIR